MTDNDRSRTSAAEIGVAAFIGAIGVALLWPDPVGMSRILQVLLGSFIVIFLLFCLIDYAKEPR